MRKISSMFVMLAIIGVAGCSNGHEAIQSEKNTQYKYESVADYNEFIIRPNIKTGKLMIQKKDGFMDIQMQIILSKKLETMLKSTEHPYFFSFGDEEGEELVSSMLVEKPTPIYGDLQKLKIKNHTYQLQQKLVYKKNITPQNLKQLESPKNYELQVLNQYKQVVAVIMGIG
ncbi:hypothetical protein [Bacillus sp. 1P06AnD]|uniref:hypothetical protein n=1 Tax=Bacillus sp. 1P06AnD TaxID=3132208 RepID=UPI0039A2F4E4